MVGAGVADPDAAQPALHLQRDPALTSLFRGEDRTVVGQHLRREVPSGRTRRGSLPAPRVPVKTSRATEAMQTREWSSTMLRISTSVSSASRQWVMSACQRSLGWSAQNRRHDDRGRFCGCGVTNPRRDKIRQIVETAGTGAPAGRGQVRGDGLRASVRARLVRLLRSRMIWSSTSMPTARGLACGPSDRGSNTPPRPPRSKRLTSFCTHNREMPYSRATSLFDYGPHTRRR